MEQKKIIRLERVLGAMSALLEEPPTRENCKKFYRMTQIYTRALGHFDIMHPPRELLKYIDRGTELIEEKIARYLKAA